MRDGREPLLKKKEPRTAMDQHAAGSVAGDASRKISARDPPNHGGEWQSTAMCCDRGIRRTFEAGDKVAKFAITLRS